MTVSLSALLPPDRWSTAVDKARPAATFFLHSSLSLCSVLFISSLHPAAPVPSRDPLPGLCLPSLPTYLFRHPITRTSPSWSRFSINASSLCFAPYSPLRIEQ